MIVYYTHKQEPLHSLSEMFPPAADGDKYRDLLLHSLQTQDVRTPVLNEMTLSSPSTRAQSTLQEKAERMY